MAIDYTKPVQPGQPFLFNLEEGGKLKQQMALADMYRAQRNEDMARGQKRGQELFSAGAFGRVDDSQNKGFLELMQRRMGGYDSGEFGALRDTINRNLQRQYAGQASNLQKQQGYSGVGGATASAQMAKLAKDTNRGAQEQYQDFLIKNIEAKKDAATDYGSALKSMQDVQAGNIDRQKAELLARFQTELGYAGLGAADRAASIQGAAALQQQVDAGKAQPSKKLI